jgi:hypothetical protein
MVNKLTDQEFQEVQEIRKSISEVAAILGDLNYQKTALDLMIDEQKEKVKQIKIKEYTFFENIRRSYGNVSVNIDTGEIN